MPNFKRPRPAKLNLKKKKKKPNPATMVQNPTEKFEHNPDDPTCPRDGEDVWELREKAADGSLCNVSVFSNQHPLYHRILTELLGNDKLDIWHCLVGDYLIIPDIIEKMRSTFVTAFWYSLFPKTPLLPKSDDCWGSMKQTFGEAVATIASTTNIEGGYLTLLFEIVCPNRTTFDEVRHDRGGAYLFGGMANGKWIDDFPTQKSFPMLAKTIVKTPADATSILLSSPHKEGYILNRCSSTLLTLYTQSVMIQIAENH